ncbi:hypothetical protein HELRODRAFT_154240 [Helobdella robusta]|uniref:Vesicle transport protein n=1 Tax=Helobdella robusta TaxID=6412 RepID=T1ELE2_HELRO|nr:hypothetical protein HELRODRAFT_154240 [Helobdella robusta]ESN94189.1 hypothetical protein HELRODRAFT_154240 [Helobdella robusta]
MNISEKINNIKKTITGQPADDENQIVPEIVDVTTLSWSTRLKGFIICFSIGVLCSILGSCFLFLPGAGLTLFAILYTLGNVTALISTCFLMGPCNQLKRMFAPTRLIATIIVVISLALTLCAALWWKLSAVAILFCIIQFLAMTWYGLSYIPFARDAVMKCFESCMS